MDEWDEDAARFRKNRKPIWTALGLNTLLALLFLGAPYALGQWRSMGSRHAFARFAACMWGGEPADSPGLGLPAGEELHFADRMIHGPEGWPATCREPLGEVNRGWAPLLFPSVEQAEGIVREAVSQVRRELSAVARMRARTGPPSHVPMGLHLSVERLMAALSYRAQVAGEGAPMTDPAIRFVRDPGIVQPTRIPLRTSADAHLRIGARGDGLIATASDDRSIVHVKVGGGGMTLQHVKRPELVRGSVRGPGERPWLLWAMPEARCTDDPFRCAGHASGIARLSQDHTRAPSPRWLAGHPHGAPDRAVHVRAAPDGGFDVHMVTRRVEGGAEVRRFSLSGAPWADAQDDGEPAPPATAATTWSLESHADPDPVLLVDTDPPRAVWAAREDGQTVLRSRMLGASGDPRAEPLELARWPLEDGHPPEPVRCRADGVVWLLLPGPGRRPLLRLTGRSEDRVSSVTAPNGSRLACDRTTAVVASPSAADGVSVRTCTEGRGCSTASTLPATPSSLALVREAGVTALAFGLGEREHLRVTVWRDGEAPPQPRIVAPCFGGEGGMCGRPHLAARNGRIVLGARDGGDLLTIETTDGGRTWKPMIGLR